MPKFEAVPFGRARPNVVLPRGARLEVPPGDPNGWVVQFFTEFARGVAGCCFCDAPIPKEVTRFAIKVRLPEPVIGENGKTRYTQTYYAHTGCFGAIVGQEVRRSKDTCWDCGEPAPEGGPHPYTAFTVSRMAPSRLCFRCSQKPKWKQCGGCHMYFPHYMLQTVIDLPEPDAFNPFAFDDDVPVRFYPRNDGRDVYGCEWCIRRAGVRTEEQAAAERLAFEETRRRIAQEGIFGEDD